VANPAPNLGASNGQLFTVIPSAQTITFGSLADQSLGTPPLEITATASSGLPASFASLSTGVCTVSGAMMTLVASGTCTIRASQAGNSTYAAAQNVDRSFTVLPAQQTITFGALPNLSMRDTPYNVSASATSGLAVSFSPLTPGVCTVSGATVTLVAGGTCTIRASQAGNSTYAAAQNVDQSFEILDRILFLPFIVRDA
jgi:ribosomal protein S11